MGIRKEDITPAIAKLMSTSDKARYAPDLLKTDVTLTKSGIQIAQEVTRLNRLEREEHNIFSRWLNLHGYKANGHSRTDKKTRQTSGLPDFQVFRKPTGANPSEISECILIDFKQPGKRLSEEQEFWARHCAGQVHVLNTALEAINLVIRLFGL